MRGESILDTQPRDGGKEKVVKGGKTIKFEFEVNSNNSSLYNLSKNNSRAERNSTGGCCKKIKKKKRIIIFFVQNFFFFFFLL